MLSLEVLNVVEENRKRSDALLGFVVDIVVEVVVNPPLSVCAVQRFNGATDWSTMYCDSGDL